VSAIAKLLFSPKRLIWTLLLAGSLLLLISFNNNTKQITQMDSAEMNIEFKPVEWAHTTNIYEVNVRQYTKEGTFNAFGKELPRLKDMGVQTLWFMPVTPIAKKNRKGTLGSYYACSDYTAINPEFGTLDDFKYLVKQAHSMGFKVIIDWVANHTGWDHIWTKQHPEYYLRDSSTEDFKMASGMDDIIELDYSNPDMVKAMIDALQFWVMECDIDGFRCDLAFWVGLPFWIKARKELDKVKYLFWLGEFDEIDHPAYGKVFDASYTWTWMHKTEDFNKKHLPIDSLEFVLQQYNNIGNHSMRAWFTSNHDENSWNGTEYEKYNGMAKTLAVFSCTWNGIPLIYSGQEIPNRRRLKFFDKDQIEWTGFYELNDFYKTLLHLHIAHPALRAGDDNVKTFRIKTNDDAHVFAYMRKNGDREVLVLLNLSPFDNLFTITDEMILGVFKNVFTNIINNFSAEKKLEIPAWGYLVFEK
jgi:alpha-amylase